MQTFLPFEDFARSARALDDRRLGKQRVEALQILRALHLDGYGWRAHPAVAMWRGHTDALVAYGLAIVQEWTARGHGDTTHANISEFAHPEGPRGQAELAALDRLPPWLGWACLHRSHRSALLRKDPGHYRPRLPDTPADLDYVWPRPSPPPPPPPPPARPDAWVVRGRNRGDHLAVPARDDEIPWVPLAARSGRTRKRHRQIARFVEDMSAGEVVVTPAGSTLWVGVLTGGYRSVGGQHVRGVRWLTELSRVDLDFPAGLQDPQDVFALHDEPAIVRAASRRGGPPDPVEVPGDRA